MNRKIAELLPESRPLEDLLPFYASGRLAPGEMAQVENALKRDPELARRLELVREEAGVCAQINEALGAPSPRAFDKLMAGIEAEPKRIAQAVQATRSGLMERLGAMLAALSPRTLAYATAAAVGVIALQGVMLSGITPKGGTYEVASASASGTHVLVSFAPEAKAAAIQTLLASTGASIVEGPRASGLYRLRLSDKALPKDEIARILAQLLKAKDIVAFAAPET